MGNTTFVSYKALHFTRDVLWTPVSALRKRQKALRRILPWVEAFAVLDSESPSALASQGPGLPSSRDPIRHEVTETICSLAERQGLPPVRRKQLRGPTLPGSDGENKLQRPVASYLSELG